MVQADPNYRLDEASLNRHFVRLSNGEMAPLSQFVTLTKVYGAESLNRFNMYNSIALNAMPAEGYSSGEAIRAVQETAARVLPANYDFDFGGLAREESNQSNTTIVIFAICLLMVYLLLSALYESFFVPFAVLLSVPAGLMGSFLFAKLLGLEIISICKRDSSCLSVCWQNSYSSHRICYRTPSCRYESDVCCAYCC